jgi:hypothetical protein
MQYSIDNNFSRNVLLGVVRAVSKRELERAETSKLFGRVL